MLNFIESLPETCKRVPNAMNWVDIQGNLYGIETRVRYDKNNNKIKSKHYGKFFKYRTTINKNNGYVYAPIKYIIDEEKEIYINKQRRLHIIIAQVFIDNPNNYPIVGHKNNIKHDNRIENLYWTTVQENTQKAFDDGLAVNAKSYEDSQSHPVIMFDAYTNQEIGRYGSCREASRETGIGLNTIINQAKHKKPIRNSFYFRFQDDKNIDPPEIIVQYDYNTDKELGRYYNIAEASRQTNISSKTIDQQCSNNKKSRRKTKSGTYFLRLEDNKTMLTNTPIYDNIKEM